MNPFELDWGGVTPEGFDKSKNQVLHVLNIYMQNTEGRRLSLIFLVGRLIWFNKHLPPNCSHRIRIDIGGQTIPLKILNKWRESALSIIHKKIPTVNIEIEFLV